MSDCSTHAFDVPLCERGIVHHPQKPSMEKLVELYGEPPWMLQLDCSSDFIDHVEAIEMGGVRFVREEAHAH